MLHVAVLLSGPSYLVDYSAWNSVWFWVWLPLVAGGPIAVETLFVLMRYRHADRPTWRRPSVFVPVLTAGVMLAQAGIGWAAFHGRATGMLTNYGPGYGEPFRTLQQFDSLDFVVALCVTFWVFFYCLAVPSEAR